LGKEVLHALGVIAYKNGVGNIAFYARFFAGEVDLFVLPVHAYKEVRGIAFGPGDQDMPAVAADLDMEGARRREGQALFPLPANRLGVVVKIGTRLRAGARRAFG